MADPTPRTLTKEDFDSGLDVRWCPGCGDYAILANVLRFLPTLGIPPEQFVFVSGIGCSSRFPYYVNTYGFHGIHGRAPAIATGVKLTNPGLQVWIVTGDGDALGIGGNHFIHLLRRNVDVVVLLFNNRIYGLTKGQLSPTSALGQVTKSSPDGTAYHPFNPLRLALGANGSFVARAVDSDPAGLTQVLKEAAAHRGTSFVEIYQNCRIFNDGAFEPVATSKGRAENQLLLEHGKPLLFGKDHEKGIRLRGFKPEVVDVAPGEAEAAGIAVYDRHDPLLATLVASFDDPAFPVPVGVLFQEVRPTFEDLYFKGTGSIFGQVTPPPDPDAVLKDLFASGETWVEK